MIDSTGQVWRCEDCDIFIPNTLAAIVHEAREGHSVMPFPSVEEVVNAEG